MRLRTARVSKSFDEHLLAVDAVWEASLPDFDRGRNVVPGSVDWQRALIRNVRYSWSTLAQRTCGFHVDKQWTVVSANEVVRHASDPLTVDDRAKLERLTCDPLRVPVEVHHH
jgi:hypothetical protein